MANLRQVYAEGRDVRDSDIPEIWKESFNRFMIGQACQAETNEDGTVKEFIYYACDFRAWYHENKEAIERDIKIDKILK